MSWYWGHLSACHALVVSALVTCIQLLTLKGTRSRISRVKGWCHSHSGGSCRSSSCGPVPLPVLRNVTPWPETWWLMPCTRESWMGSVCRFFGAVGSIRLLLGSWNSIAFYLRIKFVSADDISRCQRLSKKGKVVKVLMVLEKSDSSLTAAESKTSSKSPSASCGREHRVYSWSLSLVGSRFADLSKWQLLCLCGAPLIQSSLSWSSGQHWFFFFFVMVFTF